MVAANTTIASYSMFVAVESGAIVARHGPGSAFSWVFNYLLAMSSSLRSRRFAFWTIINVYQPVCRHEPLT